MITYQEEIFANIKDEIPPLLQKHWEELANHKEERPLDPDYKMYETLNDLGLIKVFAVRDDLTLIGYAAFVVSHNLHYKTWNHAVSDVYYLEPSYRKTGVSFEMFNKIEAWLKSLGVNYVTVQDKVNHSHGKFFEALGYKVIEHVYEKVI